MKDLLMILLIVIGQFIALKLAYDSGYLQSKAETIEMFDKLMKEQEKENDKKKL